MDGTKPVNPPSRRPDENQRPSNPGGFPPNIQTGGDESNNEFTLDEILFPSSTSEDDAISPNNESNELEATPSNTESNELEAAPSNTNAVNDFNTLLASLESDDEQEPSIDDEIQMVGEARAVPTVLLETPPNRGLDDNDLIQRRKRYGWNYMKEENRSHFKTFLSFFVGPIQCVMLVSQGPYPSIRSSARLFPPKRVVLS